jgi:hypothetical protein
MMYVEYEQEFIDELQREIGLEHPLYRREVFAIAVRRDPDAVIFQTADGEIYAIVHLTWSGRRAVGMPLTELLENRQAVGQRITADHAEWLEHTSGCKMTDPMVLAWCSGALHSFYDRLYDRTFSTPSAFL